MQIKTEPILPGFGAEVSGVDISRPLDPATAREIVAIQNTWGVTVWRDTGLDESQGAELAR